MIIDLRSDTVTKPSKGMLEAMMNARVGDDVFGEDTTVLTLENRVAEMFSMDAGLFCPSGTMANQIAIKLQTNPGDEVICDATSHIYNYETGGMGFNSGVQPKLVNGKMGIISHNDIAPIINPDFDWLAKTSLVSIENTANRAGGSYYTYKEMQNISNLCAKHNLKFHLDGARIFNALAETKDNPKEIGKLFNTVSVCFSKGLGAPVGSVLLGKKEEIKKARRIRKALGGGMRQAGYLAAACIYALDNNVGRLTKDHKNAKEIAKTLNNLKYIESVLPVKTNIIIFSLNKKIKPDVFINYLKKNNILVTSFGGQLIRMVTHLDFNYNMIDILTKALNKFK
jgi:threonine aldolase